MNTPTEPHAALAYAVTSVYDVGNYDQAAQLIADSEAAAVSAAVTLLTCTHHTDKDRKDCPVCLVRTLRAEVEHSKFLHQCESDSSVEAFARAEKAEAKLAAVRAQVVEKS